MGINLIFPLYLFNFLESGGVCGRTKLCLDNPKGCDPSGSFLIFFTSVQIILSRSTINQMAELSGNPIGYIALAKKLFQRFLGQMAVAVAVTALGLLHTV